MHTVVNLKFALWLGKSILTYVGPTYLVTQQTFSADISYMVVYSNLFIYSNVSFIGLLNLSSRYTF